MSTRVHLLFFVSPCCSSFLVFYVVFLSFLYVDFCVVSYAFNGVGVSVLSILDCPLVFFNVYYLIGCITGLFFLNHTVCKHFVGIQDY